MANHDQNLESRFRLLKVCSFVKLESSELQDLLAKSARLDRSKIRLDRSNLGQINFLRIFSNSAQARFDLYGFIFYSKYKRKNPSYVLEVFLMCCIESLVRSRGVYLHIHLELSRSRFMSRTWWSLQLLQKKLKEDLKRLSGVSKSQVGVHVVVVDQGKK